MVGKWNKVSPDGTKSVKANETINQNNTTYIENNLSLDHYWGEDANHDGYHKAVTLTKQTSDPSIPVGLDAIQYVKDTTEGRTEGFHRNVDGIYQYIPSFLSGTHNITSSYTTLVAVPANSYGEIFMWNGNAGKTTGQRAFFVSNAILCQTWAHTLGNQGASNRINLYFGNGTSASLLNIRVRTEDATSGNDWDYRITYWEQ